MKAITKDYLIDIIYRTVNKNIGVYRASKNLEQTANNLIAATDAEMLDFIHSIPYFDERLKDFLVGNLSDETIIVSQAWELEFLKKVMAWAGSFEWLHGNTDFFSDAHIDNIKKSVSFLTLPY